MNLEVGKNEFLTKLGGLKTRHEVLKLKSEFGSFISEFFGQVKLQDADGKKVLGAQINKAKITLDDAISAKLEEIRCSEINSSLESEIIDISLPFESPKRGTIHPISFVTNELVTIMQRYGFKLINSQEIEDVYYNFDALNMKESHPARDMHDTFYLDFLDPSGKNYLLRTHTSSAEIRGMMAGKPPFALVSAGRTYRKDMDRTHTPMFNQMECLYVDEGVNMGNLLWMLDSVLSEFFDKNKVKIRLRPSFFPFTEPSAEVDIDIGGGWLEVLGAGMTHPNVLRNCGVDPEKYSGFAFGMGIERLAMLKYGMRDLRDFFNPSLEWNDFYGFQI